MKRVVFFWLLVAFAGFAFLPWYIGYGDLLPSSLVTGEMRQGHESALFEIAFFQSFWLLPIALMFPAIAVLFFVPLTPLRRAWGLLITSGLSLFYIALQGFSIVSSGPRALTSFFTLLGAEAGQQGLGIGALVVVLSLIFIASSGISSLGKGRGDIFVTGSISLIVSLVFVFIFFPVAHILVRAFDSGEASGFFDFLSRFFSSRIWGLDCLVGGSCGSAINSIVLGILTGIGTTALGLAFALIFTRTQFRFKKVLRVLTIIPIITPPFVIGLALILLFGRSGTVTTEVADFLGLEPSRWLYGFTGVFLAQMLSFTPIAFLILIGVVEGVNPSLEEASQTLHAGRWETFIRVSLPLMRPGLANAFLIGFIESVADFGNPLVLGSHFNVLSTEIYFAIVGADADTNRAAILSLTLLILALGVFFIQRTWLGKKSYTTVTGKPDSGQHAGLSPKLKATCYAFALPWAGFTAIVYSMIIFGSIVKLWGYDHSFTLAHYLRGFAIDIHNGLRWVGVAWDSYFTTITISAIAAPLTALTGLLAAYLLVRQRFPGKSAFEFMSMVSFAIPGTIVGVSYIMAFNFPPIELTGTGVILIIVFIFRNMPVGLRGGIAAMSQIDKSLDEASITLGANSFTTIRRVIAPLLGPATLAALSYSFVRAITSVSAVIFLVSAEYNMATSFIVGRVENGEFGLAIAYSAVLIVTMLTVLLLMQLCLGRRKLRRVNRLQTTV